MQTSNTPIVFINFGLQPHLLYAAIQAKRLSPASRVIVLLDQPLHIDGLEVVPMQDFFSSAQAFAQHYRHQSQNAHWSELICFLRWFVLRDYLKHNPIPRLIHLDSDVLLYCESGGAFHEFEGCDFGLTSISAHTAFFSAAVIPEICSVFEDYYLRGDARVSDFVRERMSRPGTNVCDMLFLDYFRQFTPRQSFELFSVLGNEGQRYFFDHNLNDKDCGFKMNGGIKHIEWLDGAPYGRLNDSGELIRFKSIHYQGANGKAYIQEHFEKTGRGSTLP